MQTSRGFCRNVGRGDAAFWQGLFLVSVGLLSCVDCLQRGPDLKDFLSCGAAALLAEIVHNTLIAESVVFCYARGRKRALRFMTRTAKG